MTCRLRRPAILSIITYILRRGPHAAQRNGPSPGGPVPGRSSSCAPGPAFATAPKEITWTRR